MRHFARLVPMFGAVAVALALPMPAGAATESGTSTLHVIGNGRVFVTPDLATVTITTDRAAATRQVARARVSRVVARMVRGFVGIGIARLDIQTSSITLNSSTVRLGPHRHRIVYDAEIDLNVTITQIKLLSPLFGIATGAGADSFAGPNFGFADPSAGLRDATTAAVSDARSRADAAAAQLGVSVVGVQSIDLDPGSTPLPAARAPGAAKIPAPVSAPGATPVLPGRQEVDVSVDIVFLLGS
jgi:uncharacterized protein YggE